MSVYQGILDSVLEVAAVDLAAILSIEPDRQLRVLASAGRLDTPTLRSLRISLEQRPLLREALERNHPTILHSEPHDEPEEPDTFDGVVALPGDHSCLVAPLRFDGRLEGLLTLDVAVCRAFDPTQVKAIGTLADMAGRLIHEEQRSATLARELDRLATVRAGLQPDGAAGAYLVGNARSWLDVVERARLAAPTNATVVITGETGTGKEQVARAIHQWSLRAAGPFMALNCSAIVPELAGSELFGHERGAFTGADRRREGRFLLAEKGTLFLDEVADLPLPVQAQLLRVIQERVFERVGGANSLLHADVRLIAATHKDLLEEVRSGRFREDLYFRLNTFPIDVPPLRDRPGDIPLLASHLLQRIAKETGMSGLALGSAALRMLEAQPWRGNVRELYNALVRAAILARGQTIQPRHLEPAPARMADERNPNQPHQTQDPRVPTPLRRLDRAIAAEVLAALDESGGQVAGPGGAAAKLGMPPTTLHSLMKRLQLQRPSSRPLDSPGPAA